MIIQLYSGKKLEINRSNDMKEHFIQKGELMKYVENIVIGKPIVDPCDMFAKNMEDWDKNEKEKTYYTEERFLPKILVEIGATKSVNEIRRNRKDLLVTLNDLAYMEIKLGKRRLFILVGKQRKKDTQSLMKCKWRNN